MLLSFLLLTNVLLLLLTVNIVLVVDVVAIAAVVLGCGGVSDVAMAASVV